MNHAYITAPDHPTALDKLTTAITNQWFDQPARVRQSELSVTRRSSIAQQLSTS